MSGEIQMVGNWKRQIEDPLQGALQASVEICGRSFFEACKHAIILMAQSARALTKQAPKNRKLQRDGAKGRPYFLKYKKDGSTAKWYLPNRKQEPEKYADMLAKLKPIRGRGLAKRSWMWGLRDLDPGKVDSRPISGVADTRKYIGQNEGGFILTNRLKYLLKILPSGWDRIVAEKASNKIMKQAALKIERQWKRAMAQKQRAGFVIGRTIGQYFLRG